MPKRREKKESQIEMDIELTLTTNVFVEVYRVI